MKPSSLDKHTSKLKVTSVTDTSKASSKSDSSASEFKLKDSTVKKIDGAGEKEEEKEVTIGFKNTCTFGTKSLSKTHVKEEIKDSSFVFGESMESRATSTNRNGAISPVSEDSSDSKSETDSKDDKSNESSKSLIESAREAEKLKNVRYEMTNEEEIITGEEDDSNVFQIHAKLFIYNFKDSSWRDIGRVIVRLNDLFKEEGPFSSRLVIRSGACQKVLLNLKLSSKMSICQTCNNSKKLKLTAPSQEKDGIIQMYLISLIKNDDIYNVLHSITSRIDQLKINEIRKTIEIESDNDSNDVKILKRQYTDDEDDLVDKCEREEMAKQLRIEGTVVNDV